ncbi:MAG: NAD(P)(+) transhydrogenase (Re/Si-specific) subunit beta [Phycisphaeraceae bacterium]
MHTFAITTTDVVNLAYLLAAVLFIFGLKMLSHVKTARQGNLVSAVGMLIAAVVTLFLVNQNAMPGQSHLISFLWIGVALAMGSVIGLFLALKVQMTAMPQMVALLNGFGGLASLLVACAEYANKWTRIDQVADLTRSSVQAPASDAVVQQLAEASFDWYVLLAIGLATLIGGVTFTGSLVAFGKLQGLKITPTAPIQFAGQKALIAVLLLGSLILACYLIPQPDFLFALILIVLFSLALGILLVIGIGGADMPVVVALLNSYSGLAAAMAGFALGNFALIITGSLVGSSGLILTNIMCKAMNRSLMNVLFGGVGGGTDASAAVSGETQGEAREFTPEDAALVLEAAQQVMIVPGYGMAVAQAQHAVKELADNLESRGVAVKYAIHPVAGRMPGHMNVLLAEAGVPYENLLDLEQANNEFEQTDVALIIGANDVTNPAARHDKGSPIYGMPILDVDKARNVFVIKRSMSPGFAGIQNELYFKENCGMIFGDGKKVVTDLVAQLEDL